VLWEKNENTPDIASLLLSDNRLYYTARKSGILSCVDAKSGKPHYENQRIDGVRELYSSPVAAAGRVYITGRDGTTTVIRDSEDLEVLATNRLGEPVDTTPALAGEDIIIRSAKHLYLISK
jgi:outer membrane protein assembly factor BamB